MNFDVLRKYVPESSLFYLQKWLAPYSFQISIKNARKNRLGDYHFPKSGESHKITVNNNLSHELCFLVLTHEIAHLLAFDKNRKIAPHGIEWKQTFSFLLTESLSVYSDELQVLLKNFAKNPKGSFYADKQLAYFFLSGNENYTNLSQIPLNEKFILNNKVFIKLNKKNSKYICKELKSGRTYLVHALAPIEIL